MVNAGTLRSLVCVGLGAVLGLIAASGNFHLFQPAEAAPPSEQQINGRSPSGLESSTATAAACCTDELNKGLLLAQAETKKTAAGTAQKKAASGAAAGKKPNILVI